jgi:hypothetical protein
MKSRAREGETRNVKEWVRIGWKWERSRDQRRVRWWETRERMRGERELINKEREYTD